MSGLSINFKKSLAKCLGGNDSQHVEIASMFNCKVGSLNLTHLDIPIKASRLHKEDWQSIVDRENLFGEALAFLRLVV